MRKIALFAVSLLITTSALAQATFDFKGVALRSSEAELLAAHPGFKCSASKAPGMSRECMLLPVHACASGVTGDACVAARTYGGVPYKIIAVRFIDGVGMVGLSVHLEASGFKQLAEALTTKLGAPAQRKLETMRTKAGVEHENVKLSWTSERGDVLNADRLSWDINTSSVHISTPEAVAAFTATKRESIRAGAGNL